VLVKACWVEEVAEGGIFGVLKQTSISRVWRPTTSVCHRIAAISRPESEAAETDDLPSDEIWCREGESGG